MADAPAPVRVLMAEDSATQAALLRAILEEEGFKVGSRSTSCSATS